MASIRKRQDVDGGGYQVRYYAPDGRLRSKTFRSRREAVRFANEAEADIGRGSWHDPALGDTRLDDYIRQYLSTTAHWRISTRTKAEGHINNYILPAFGRVSVARIRPMDVREWVAALIAHGLAPGTVRAVYASFSRVMNQAVIDGLIPRSPCLGVTLPKDEVRREMHVLEPAQIEQLADAVAPRYRALIFTAAYTGLRWGELAALRLKNLDLVAGSISVVESVTEVKGILHVGPTKTGATRTIALPNFLRQMLADHTKEFPSAAHVFTSAKNHPLRRNFYHREFVPAVKRARLPEGFRFHDLRHTCAALLIANGAHPKEIQERMGHSTIRVTFDRYGHLFPTLDERLRDGLEQMYRAARNSEPNHD